MSVPATESFPFPITPPALAMGSFGQSVTVPSVGGGPGYSLVSYLTAPLPNASRLDYVVLCHEDADDWRWNFRSPGGKWSFKSTSGEPVANFVFGGVGTLEVEVEVLKDGKRRALLTLSQAVVAPGTAFATVSASVGAAGGDMEFALREICEDFRTYINDAAAATGPNGIPSRLLAAVLFMEVRARPKDDSPKAMIIRGKLAGQSYDPRMDAFEESVARAKGSPIYRVHLQDRKSVV